MTTTMVLSTIIDTLSGNISGGRVKRLLLDHFETNQLDASHLDLIIPHSDTIAFQNVSGKTLTFNQIHNIIDKMQGIFSGRRVAIVLPNSLELICTIIMTMATGATAIPVCCTNPPEEIIRDVTRMSANVLIILDNKVQSEWVKQLDNLDIVTITDTFEFSHSSLKDSKSDASNTALLIQTSGSTGKKKIVPHTIEDIIIGIVCIGASMELTETDVCCCMMPLFHAGGIFRSILCPLLSGSKVVIHDGFNAETFWKTHLHMKYTWYYGSPTMHAAILEMQPDPNVQCHDIRIIANAAGGLLPTLAKRLAKTFPCATIMPSYGMTECMPVAAPPITYKLEKEKSSGRIIGPDVCIMDVSTKTPLKVASTPGAVCIRGPPTFRGYEGTLVAETFLPDGWFDTGDLGYLDDDGYLFITGRAKEVIKRGGETISPYEVEEQISSHLKIRDVVAFSVPHTMLQEVVGLVVVSKNEFDRPSYTDIRKYASNKLHPSKWPCVIVYASELPKGPTGKITRVGLAIQWKIPPIVDDDNLIVAYELYDGIAHPLKNTYRRSLDLRRSIEWKNLTITERSVVCTFRKILRCDVGVHDDFFLEGGDSIKAAFAASELANKLCKDVSPFNIFQHRTAHTLANYIMDQESTKKQSNDNTIVNIEQNLTHPIVLFTQLLPLIVFRPITQYMVFALGYLMWTALGRDVVSIGPALLFANFVKSTVLPLISILFKWIVIGRIRPGKYPLWGSLYIRWWLSQQLNTICGLGVFGWSFQLHRMYMCLMGAHVGRNVRVSVDAHIGDYDLLSFDDDVVIDPRAYVRASTCSDFMLCLEPITVGKRVLLSRGACVSPGATIPDDTVVLPNTSSHNGTVEKNTHMCEMIAPRVSLRYRFLLGYPCLVLLRILQSIPLSIVIGTHNVLDIKRLFYTLVMVYSVSAPIIRIAYTIVIKNAFLGRFIIGRPNDFENFKYWMMSNLLPQPDLAGVQTLVGAHWAPTSWILRALGVHVGKRVFWPGSGVDIDAYDLVTIEDDVVWGSRSFVQCRNTKGNAQTVVMRAGSNVADRCIIYRGARIGRNTCMGTGSVALENTDYGDGTLWIGSGTNGAVCLVQPNTKQAKLVADQVTVKPFGKTKTYALPPWWLWAMMETMMTLTIVTLRLLPLMFGGIHIGRYVSIQWAVDVACICACISAKWLIIGRRCIGTYPWDTSNYCMRWNIDLIVQRMRGKLLDLLGGSAFIVWYYRALGANIGKNVCLFPVGSDPMFTEPDLVTVGDNACINYAFVINHVNTRGDFQLNTINIGSNCTLRAYSRAMAGSVMESGSTLQERSLLMPGEKLLKQNKKTGWP